MRTAGHLLVGAVLIAAWTAPGPAAHAAAAPQVTVAPLAGPPGATVTVTGSGFCPAPCTAVDVSFGGAIVRTGIPVGAGGHFQTTFTVPASALGGVNNVFAEQRDTTRSDRQANTSFRVTPSTPASGPSAQQAPRSAGNTAPQQHTPAPTTTAPRSLPQHSTATGASPRSSSPSTTTRAAGAPPSTPPASLAATPTAADRGDDGFPAWWWIPIGLAIAGAAIGVIAWRRRTTRA